MSQITGGYYYYLNLLNGFKELCLETKIKKINQISLLNVIFFITISMNETGI